MEGNDSAIVDMVDRCCEFCRLDAGVVGTLFRLLSRSREPHTTLPSPSWSVPATPNEFVVSSSLAAPAQC